MAVRTKRLAAGLTGPASVGKTAYTCPSGETAIVKDVRLYARAGAVSSVKVFALSGAGIFVACFTGPMADQEVRQFQGFLVLLPGDRVVVEATTTDGIAYWVSGTELEGLAD